MDTPYRGQTPADDLFDRDETNQGGSGTYSPLEKLVRQTSLKSGWRVKGSQNVFGEPQHSPNPAQKYERSLLGGASSSNHPYIHARGERVFDRHQLAPERPLHRQELQPPSSPLVHAEFRHSAANSYDGEGDSNVDMSPDASSLARDPANPFLLSSRLVTTEDDAIDRVRAEQQWDSASDIDSPLDPSTRGILPPSFRFEDSSASSPTNSGRPLSDRSLVLPPSVKGLSLKNKSASPNSPAQMSFYSESSYGSSSKLPLQYPPSFLLSRSSANSPVPPPPAVPRTSLSDASEPSVYGDSGPLSSPQASADAGDTVDFAAVLEGSGSAPAPARTTKDAPNASRNDEEVDLADAFERSATGQWGNTRDSDLDPFAFRQYEGRDRFVPSAQPIAKPRPPGQTLQVGGSQASPDVSLSTAPNIVVTSEPSTSPRNRSFTYPKFKRPSSPISSVTPSPIISYYSYVPDTPQTNKTPRKPDNGPSTMQLPMSQSAPVALSSPLHSPAIAAIELPPPATSQAMSPENRAPSLVSANLGGRFNFSRPIRSHNVLSTSPSAPGDISANYVDSGWSTTADASGVSSSSQIATPDETARKGLYVRELGGNSRLPPGAPQFRKQTQSNVSPIGVDSSPNRRPHTADPLRSLGSHFGAPGLRNNADSYRESGSSGGSGNSESFYALEQRFPVPPGSRENSSANLSVVVASADGTVTEESVTAGTGTILGQGRRSLDDSNRPAVSFGRPFICLQCFIMASPTCRTLHREGWRNKADYHLPLI